MTDEQTQAEWEHMAASLVSKVVHAFVPFVHSDQDKAQAYLSLKEAFYDSGMGWFWDMGYRHIETTMALEKIPTQTNSQDEKET